MRIIIRSNNHFANKTLRGLGGAEVWLKNLSKYLSDNATIKLSLMEDKRNFAEASLDIYDNGVHINSKAKNEDMVNAINSAIAKTAVQLKKKKNKEINHNTIIDKDSLLSFTDLDERINLEPNIMHNYEFLEAEKTLALKKNSPKYKRVTKRYIDYLYGIKDIESAIVRAKEHLSILKHILDTEIDTMLYRDHEALIASIKQIENEIKDLNNRKKNYKMNIRDEEYINDRIEEELNVLRLKRK